MTIVINGIAYEFDDWIHLIEILEENANAVWSDYRSDGVYDF